MISLISKEPSWPIAKENLFGDLKSPVLGEIALR
jgi:hypothetical protein